MWRGFTYMLGQAQYYYAVVCCKMARGSKTHARNAHAVPVCLARFLRSGVALCNYLELLNLCILLKFHFRTLHFRLKICGLLCCRYATMWFSLSTMALYFASWCLFWCSCELPMCSLVPAVALIAIAPNATTMNIAVLRLCVHRHCQCSGVYECS